MKIAGIDPSLTRTGMCVIEPGRVVVTTASSKPGIGTPTILSRLYRIGQIMASVHGFLGLDSDALRPDLLVIEAPAYDSRSGHQHERSGLWWEIVRTATYAGVDVVEVTTGGRAKYATGKGNAGKDAVLAAVVRRYDGMVLVNDNNEADALVLAAMGARHLGEPIEREPLPKLNEAALDAVRWPA